MSHEAVADFEPEGDNEIRLQIGDKFKKVKDVGNGWLLGTNIGTDETGVFPATYVQKADITSTIIRRFTKKKSLKTSAGSKLPQRLWENPEDLTPQQSSRPEHVSMEMTNFEKQHGTDTEVSDYPDDDDDDETENDIFSNPEDTDNFSHDELDEGHEHRIKEMKNFADQLFSSDRNQFTMQKGIIGAIVGILSGVCLFLILAYGYSIAVDIAGYVSLCLTLFFCLGLALSIHCRCVALLMLPSIATGRGRAILLTIIVSILLSGPVMNISKNASEVSTSMACSMDVVYNQSKDLKEQLQEPINQATEQIEENTAALRSLGNAIEKAFGPISSALNAIQSGAQTVGDALNVASTECKKLFLDAYNGCVGGIDNARSKCYEALGSLKRRKRRAVGCTITDHLKGNKSKALAFLIRGNHTRSKRALSDLCKVLDVSGVCQVLNVGSVVCAPVEALDSAANTIATNVKKGLDELKSWFAFDVIKELGLTGLANATKSAAEFISEVNTEISGNINWVDFGVTLLTNLLAVTLLLLFLQSFIYLKYYISRDSYNNVYITSAFKAYDKERQTNGESFILPLKKKEKRMYTDTKTVKMSVAEVRNSVVGFLQILLHMVFALVIVGFDYILYYCIYLVHRYGDVTIELTGQNSILLEITGTGEIAQLIRKLITGINLNNKYEADFNVTACLPTPHVPNANLFYAYAVMYILTIMAVLLQSYGLRLRRKICSYYYPEQEHARMLFLHKKIRHDRKTHQRQLKQHMRSIKKEKEMKQKEKSESKLPFANKFAKKQDVKMCLNCGTNSGGTLQFVTCSDTTCEADYCENCINELGEKCTICGGSVSKSMVSTA